MIEVLQVLTLVGVLINLGWSFYNYKRIEDVKQNMDKERIHDLMCLAFFQQLF